MKHLLAFLLVLRVWGHVSESSISVFRGEVVCWDWGQLHHLIIRNEDGGKLEAIDHAWVEGSEWKEVK